MRILFALCIILAWAAVTAGEEVGGNGAASPTLANEKFKEANRAYTAGRLKEAERLYVAAIQMDPGKADYHCNYGAMLIDTGDAVNVEKAEKAYRYALSLDAHHAGALFNLALMLQDNSQPEVLRECASLYKRLVSIEPLNFDAWSNYGATLHQMGDMPSAVEAYQRALQVFRGGGSDDSALSKVYEHLGRALLRLSELPSASPEDRGKYKTRAIDALRSAVITDSDNHIAAHMLASNIKHDASGASAAAPRGYVTKIFDDYSSTFEASLQSLGYKAPALIASMLADLGVEMSKVSVLLDLGCGTGLLPPALGVPPIKDIEGSITSPQRPVTIGVDLSPGMLKVAEEKGVYDHLYVGEIVAFLHAYSDHLDRSCEPAPGSAAHMRRKLSGSIIREHSVDAGLDGSFRVTEETLGGGLAVIAAADVLVYLGDLSGLFAAMSRALRPGDLAVFSTESAEGAEGADEQAAAAAQGWVLRTSGRYAHTAWYLRQQSESVGLEVAALQGISARRELERDVQGWLVALRGV